MIWWFDDDDYDYDYDDDDDDHYDHYDHYDYDDYDSQWHLKGVSAFATQEGSNGFKVSLHSTAIPTSCPSCKFFNSSKLHKQLVHFQEVLILEQLLRLLIQVPATPPSQVHGGPTNSIKLCQHRVK